jgi:3,4-dihydroxy 2-butanone 4-phosphate synthase
LSLEKALESFRRGNFVLVLDAADRENEVDLAIPAPAVEPKHIARLRQDAGGLICVAVHPKIADGLALPFITQVHESASPAFPVLSLTKPDDIPYDERSAFSLWVNHRKTYTGITDVDRALTIQELGRLAADGATAEEFGRNFRSPGHVPLLRAADGLLSERRGHTELVVALAELAGITPVIAICEMLDAETNRALSWEAAEEYAKQKNFCCIRGDEILEAWLRRRTS